MNVQKQSLNNKFLALSLATLCVLSTAQNATAISWVRILTFGLLGGENSQIQQQAPITVQPAATQAQLAMLAGKLGQIEYASTQASTISQLKDLVYLGAFVLAGCALYKLYRNVTNCPSKEDLERTEQRLLDEVQDVGGRVQGVDVRVQGVDVRVQGVDARVQGVGTQVNGVRADLENQKTFLTTIRTHQDQHGLEFTRVRRNQVHLELHQRNTHTEIKKLRTFTRDQRKELLARLDESDQNTAALRQDLRKQQLILNQIHQNTSSPWPSFSTRGVLQDIEKSSEQDNGRSIRPTSVWQRSGTFGQPTPPQQPQGPTTPRPNGLGNHLVSFLLN